MAKLTDKQFKLRVEREKERQKNIRRKMEIQEKKEIFGENWKIVEQAKLQRELDDEFGSEEAPKIYNSKDLYDYFDPITLYKNKESKALKMDFNKFKESEETFKDSLAEVDAMLDSIYQVNKDEEGTDNNKTEVTEAKETKKTKAQIEKEANKALMEKDGQSEADSIVPVDGDVLKETQKEEIQVGDSVVEGVKISPVALAKTKVHQVTSTYFNRFVPLYNRHVCTCCGMPKDLKDFYITYSVSCSDRVDENGNYHMSICKECANKFFSYYYSVDTKKDIEKTMMKLCSTLDIYWDVDLFYQAKKNYEDSGRKGTLLGAYISLINKDAPGMVFSDSPFFSDDKYKLKIADETSKEVVAPYDWTQEEAKNQKDIIHLLGYDPFGYEDNDDDKRILYADLSSIIDEDIQQDYVKLQSAVTIVKSFNKVRKLDEKLNQMEKEDAPLSDQKAVSDLKAKELKAISDFSRDSGFSERFKTRQSQGETSFTGILKKMNDKKYESELINKYDIQTSSTIQAAADASFKAIFNQLNLSEAEAFKLAADQLAELRKLRQENDKLQEELRLAKYQVAEVNLKEKAREKGEVV